MDRVNTAYATDTTDTTDTSDKVKRYIETPNNKM